MIKNQLHKIAIHVLEQENVKFVKVQVGVPVCMDNLVQNVLHVAKAGNVGIVLDQESNKINIERIITDNRFNHL